MTESLIFKDFMPAQEFAHLKHRTLKTVYSWVKTGKAPRYEVIGGMYWFYREEAAAFQPPKRGKQPA